MITGNKTIIRAITREDAAEIYNWVNIEELRELTGTLYPVSEFEHEEWMKKMLTTTATKLFVVLDKTSGQKLGTIGLKNFDNNSRNVELFISLAVSGGYGSDAVCTLTEYCFSHLNMHKVYLHVFESNERAIKCYEKAGFDKEGLLREHHYSNNKYEDVIVMSKLNKTK